MNYKKNLLIVCCVFSSLFLVAQEKDPYDITNVQEVKIYFKQADWNKQLDHFKENDSKDRLEAKVVIDGKKYEQCGVRFKGNSSYFNTRKTGSTKLPFNIEADFIKKDQHFPGGYTTLKLSNVFRDPSFLREVLSFKIAGTYMAAPKANFVSLYVNDEYIGLYNNTESIDEKFLLQHFGSSNGTLLKCDPNWKSAEKEGCPAGSKASLAYLGQDSSCYFRDYELKSGSWKDLIQLTEVLANSPKKLEEVLDVNQALWMLAFNTTLTNLDSYTGRLCHNYYMYKDTTGCLTPILWDMNMSFGGFRFDGVKGSLLSNEELQTMSAFLHYKTRNPERPLIVKLLGNSLYKKIYIAHIRTILNDYFVNDKYKEIATDVQNSIDQLVKNDNNKLYSYEDFKKNFTSSSKAGNAEIIGITELMDKRKDYLLSHPLFRKPPPEVTLVEHAVYKKGEINIQATVERANKVYLVYRDANSGKFSRVKMYNDGAHIDGTSGDNIFGINIPHTAGIQYYIIAIGEREAKLSPSNAAFEFYKVEENLK